MWAIRRASNNPARARCLNTVVFRASAGLGPFDSHREDKSNFPKHSLLDKWSACHASYCMTEASNRFSVVKRSLSSQAGATSGGVEEDDLEDEFSELETPEESEETEGGDVRDDTTSASESHFSRGEENLEEVLETESTVDTEVENGEKASEMRRGFTALSRLILAEPGPSITAALDKYAAGGNDLSRSEIDDTLLHLRRLKLFWKALEFSEWLETNKEFDFVERDYAIRVDLIAKVRGIQKADHYIDKIPKSFRNELVYRTLLANCVSATNAKKAEEVFNKMKDLGFSLTSFACNQLLLLHKRTDKKKIADVLLMMEKENVKPTRFTYQLLMDIKGNANDMVGMDQIVETMKAEGIEPNVHLQATLAKHYAASGLKEKAEAVVQEIETNDLKRNRWICPILLSIYADLGEVDKVEGVWGVCESKPRPQEYLAAIAAWGKLKDVEKAEAIFRKLSKANKRPTSKHYSAMLRVYADNKMLCKGKKLVKQMGDSGCHIGPIIWDAIVNLYVNAGEVEKADSVLLKAAEKDTLRPFFNSYMTLLDQYAKRGDVHNSEKIFHRMRLAGYVCRASPFHALLHTYINAKAPAYGIRERMKADNIFPNKGLTAQLSRVDAFRRTAVSDLLD